MYNDDERHTLRSTIKSIDCIMFDVTETVLIKTLLFGSCSVDTHTNTQVLNETIEQRFYESLFYY